MKHIQLHDPHEFDRRFRELSAEHPDKTYVEIYFMVEQEHIDTFGRTKYSSYDSFRVAYARRMKCKNAVSST